MQINLKETPKRIKKADAMLESATGIFSQHGYNNTKLQQITSSLDLTDKSIYYYFSSKGDLFSEVILHIQHQLDNLMEEVSAQKINHLEKLKLYSQKATAVDGLTLLMYIPSSLSDFSKFEIIKENEARHYVSWDLWFEKGHMDGSIIKGVPADQRQFLFGSLFYLHKSHVLQKGVSYKSVQPFVELMIERMFSTNYVPKK